MYLKTREGRDNKAVGIAIIMFYRSISKTNSEEEIKKKHWLLVVPTCFCIHFC